MAYNLEHVDPEERTELYADPREEEDGPRSGRLLRVGIALVVMGVFAGGLWFAYTQGMRHSGDSTGSADIPLIRADNRPFKVKPQNPGGMQIPDRDMLIYGQQRPQIEHLLPPPEQPMARPAPPPPSPVPPQVQTAVVAPSAAQQTAAPSGPGSPVPAAASQPAPDPIGERIGQLTAATPPRPAPSPTAPGKTGGLRLQLGAVRSESEARGEWQRLKRKNADLLGNLSAVAIRADLGDKGIYYRIQAGPLADATTADRVCGELRQRHLACLIIR
jgi:hypothetical protein